MARFENVEYLYGKRYTYSTFSNIVILHTYLPMKMEQSVPKRGHIKFRRG